jgi:ribosome maturation factor RimP
LKLLKSHRFFDDLIITDAFKVIVTLDGDNELHCKTIDVSKFMDSNLDREEQDYSLEVASVGGISIKINQTIQKKYRSNTDSEDFYGNY